MISDIASHLLVSAVNATKVTVRTRLVSAEIAVNFARFLLLALAGTVINQDLFGRDAMVVDVHKRTLKTVNVLNIAFHVRETATLWKNFHVWNVSEEGM